MYGTYRELTKEAILELITPYEIFSFYVKDFKPNKCIKTPFDSEKRSSFWSKVGTNGSIWFSDYGRGIEGDCFKLVQELFKCSFLESLMIINKDMKLGLGMSTFQNVVRTAEWYEQMKNRSKFIPEPSVGSIIGYTERPMDFHDLAYWLSYGFSEVMIEIYRIRAISEYFIDGFRYKADQYAYAWHTEPHLIKIYQPFNTYGFKWRSNTNNTFLQGESQLPNKGRILLIQSSLKDIGCVASRYHIPGVAPNGENGIIPRDKLDEFETRFDRIGILFDNDSSGIMAAQKMAANTRYEIFILPKIIPETKDPSDFIHYGYYKQLNSFFKFHKLC